MHKSVKLTLDNLFYVLTDAGPYVYRRDTPDVCCGCCLSSGNDSAKIAWVGGGLVLTVFFFAVQLISVR